VDPTSPQATSSNIKPLPAQSIGTDECWHLRNPTAASDYAVCTINGTWQKVTEQHHMAPMVGDRQGYL
jgi:hypothetical protein